MRLYTFNNLYLSSIQHGIQTAHVVHELFNRYYTEEHADARGSMLRDWSEDHKTMILLNAGYGEQIHALSERFSKSENPYPWADFYEEEASLDGAITCVGIILPEKIYESAARIRKMPYRNKEAFLREVEESGEIYWWDEVDGDKVRTIYELSKWEFEFVQDLNNYGMAR